jgi:hypothetical protein
VAGLTGGGGCGSGWGDGGGGGGGDAGPVFVGRSVGVLGAAIGCAAERTRTILAGRPRARVLTTTRRTGAASRRRFAERREGVRTGRARPASRLASPVYGTLTSPTTAGRAGGTVGRTGDSLA